MRFLRALLTRRCSVSMGPCRISSTRVCRRSLRPRAWCGESTTEFFRSGTPRRCRRRSGGRSCTTLEKVALVSVETGERLTYRELNERAELAADAILRAGVAVAFVVGRDVSADDLSSYLTLRIAKYKVPKRFVFLETLPRTPYGKVEKGKLREQLV